MKSKMILSAIFPVLFIFLTADLKPVHAAQKGNKLQNKKVLVVFYSRTGNTKRVGLDLAGKLKADSEELKDMKSRSGITGWLKGGRDALKKKNTEIAKIKKNPSQYDLVIIGTPVWASAMTPAVRTYISQNKDKFKQTAYYITSGNASASAIVPSMEDLSGKKGKAFTGFTTRELKDKVIYEKKLGEFLDELRTK
ncbi:MAG: hypothetical protein PHF84_04520 [bacterium]|nr:hypothetical protein [bacterium]